ncbi:MAG TPA: GTPase [Alphaproteobacteria bacterium]|nr:GTPase [Alphaproteobacteria bacterium]
MRLRSFTAPTVAQAMRLVRAELGPDAIIVSTQAEGGGPARVTAAIEPAAPAGDPAPAGIAAGKAATEGSAEQALRAIRNGFEFHGVPAVLSQRLCGLAGDALDEGSAKGEPLWALAASLDRRFRFAPLANPGDRARAIALIGPPGAGKTTSVAKLAARAVLAGRRLTVISTDTVRAGGVEQLASVTRILKLEVQVAEDPGALADAVRAAAETGGVLIDTAGANPYDEGEMQRLKTLVTAAKIEGVLVLPAGGDPLEAAEAAAAFADAGASRLLVARLDAARRLGSVLTAVEAGKLAFSEVGTTPHIADGLKPLNPISLARLLLGELISDSQSQEPLKAVS